MFNHASGFCLVFTSHWKGDVDMDANVISIASSSFVNAQNKNSSEMIMTKGVYDTWL